MPSPSSARDPSAEHRAAAFRSDLDPSVEAHLQAMGFVAAGLASRNGLDPAFQANLRVEAAMDRAIAARDVEIALLRRDRDAYRAHCATQRAALEQVNREPGLRSGLARNVRAALAEGRTLLGDTDADHVERVA